MTYQTLIEGLQIFAKYAEDGLDETIGAEHDVIFVAPGDLDISTEDIKRLDELRFLKSDMYDCWIHYV